MAYELIGENPSKAMGICIRLNIWKWYEFVMMLKYFDIIKESDISAWMSNDQIKLNKKETLNLANNIKSNLNNFEEFINKLYQKNIPYSHMPWHREVCCSVLNGTDIKYMILFLDSCGGFKVR